MIEMAPIGHVRNGRVETTDDTPALDREPYMVEFAPRPTVRRPSWSTESMRDHWRS